MRALALVLAAVPLLAGCERKGIWMEFTEGFKFVEPFDRVRVDVDHGSLLFVAYDRPDAQLKRHTSGFEHRLGPASEGVADGELALQAACDIMDRCWYDHMLELPLGVAVDITMIEGYVEIGYIDRQLDVAVDDGWIDAQQLASPVVNISFGTGDLDVELVVAPESLILETGAGDITLTVPAGTYRCDFAAPESPSIEGVTCDDAATPLLRAGTDDGALTVTGV